MSEPVRALPGTIGLTQIPGIVGKLIWLGQFINGDTSSWTHAFLVMDDGTYYSAEPGGACYRAEDYYDDRPVAFLDIELSDEKRADIVDTARGWIGVGYNWSTYLYLAAYRLRHAGMAKLFKARVSHSRKLICSQSVDEFYTLNDVHLFNDGRLPYDVTPGDLARLLLKK